MSLSSLPGNFTAAVFGASGGVGGALVERLAADPRCLHVHAGARSASKRDSAQILPFRFDLTDEASIQHAAEAIGGPDVVMVATGVLHDAGLKPEKTLRALEAASLQQAFAINTIGPALIARHVLPKLPRDRRAIFAVLSARVGSISDNRLGGWHSYRASKAALNMLVRNFAIELSRTHPLAICVALHPGTVDTALSHPFQAGVGAERLFTPARAASQLLDVVDGLTPEQSGRLFSWDGQEISP